VTHALALAVVLGQSGRIAVLSLAADNRLDAPPAGPLASALASEGLPVMAGPALRERVLGDGRPLAYELSRTVEQEVRAAQESYDRGYFSASARQASVAAESLARAAPSARREKLIPAIQILWGAALSQLKGRASVGPHFREALQRNPRIAIDQDRFAPPVQRQFEEERSRVAGGPQVPLEVSGTTGAILFVDGMPRGSLPLRIALPPHRCTLWVEVSGEPGWAHEVSLTRSTAITIDWQLEAASRLVEGEWVVELPAPQVDRRALLRRILERAGADELLGLEWTSGQTGATQVRRLAVVRYGPGGVEKGRELFPPDGVDWTRVASALRDEGNPPPTMAGSRLTATSDAAGVLVVASAPAPEGKPFPWLAAGLVAGGAALVAGAVVLGLSVHSTNAVFLGPETPRP
jgi:hypothetical protein